MIKTAVVSLMLCLLLFAYEPTPAPPVDPNESPFIFDPNQCVSVPMVALIIQAGSTHIGEIKVIEPDGDVVTITANNIMIDSIPFHNAKDPNDVLGLGRIYHFRWEWVTTIDDIGLHYINIRVSDNYNAFDERTMVILVKENRPPVITGCK